MFQWFGGQQFENVGFMIPTGKQLETKYFYFSKGIDSHHQKSETQTTWKV